MMYEILLTGVEPYIDIYCKRRLKWFIFYEYTNIIYQLNRLEQRLLIGTGFFSVNMNTQPEDL